MSIPGLSAYPDLEQKFHVQLQQASGRGCSSCKRRQVIEKFRRILDERVKRDKLIKGS